MIYTLWSSIPLPPSVFDVASYNIYAGRQHLNTYNPHMTVHRVRRVVVPSSYVEPKRGNDLALVELSTPVTWSDYIHPVCVPDAGALFPGGLSCMVTGWGHIRDQGKTGRVRPWLKCWTTATHATFSFKR